MHYKNKMICDSPAFGLFPGNNCSNMQIDTKRFNLINDTFTIFKGEVAYINSDTMQGNQNAYTLSSKVVIIEENMYINRLVICSSEIGERIDYTSGVTTVLCADGVEPNINEIEIHGHADIQFDIGNAEMCQRCFVDEEFGCCEINTCYMDHS